MHHRRRSVLCAACRSRLCGPGILLSCSGGQVAPPDLGAVLAGVFAKVFLAFLVVVSTALALPGCGAACESAYLRDSARERPYYRVDYCPGKAPRIVCDSSARLPNGECK